jgi:AbrB family looped-hinge helix DNA binding protein
MRARVTQKGQVTIPKRIRDVLQTQEVEFVLEDNAVILRPGRSARGSLSEYADPEARRAEEGAWPQAVAQAHEETSE